MMGLNAFFFLALGSVPPLSLPLDGEGRLAIVTPLVDYYYIID